MNVFSNLWIPLRSNVKLLLFLHWASVWRIIFINAVSSYIKSLRHEKWNNETHNKLHHFQPLIGITPLSGIYLRQDETVLRWWRIGHTYYTHSYILKGEDRPRCVGCEEDILCLIVWTFQTSARGFIHLFTHVPGYQILSFLKGLVFMESFKLIIICIKLLIHRHNLKPFVSLYYSMHNFNYTFLACFSCFFIFNTSYS